MRGPGSGQWPGLRAPSGRFHRTARVGRIQFVSFAPACCVSGEPSGRTQSPLRRESGWCPLDWPVRSVARGAFWENAVSPLARLGLAPTGLASACSGSEGLLGDPSLPSGESWVGAHWTGQCVACRTLSVGGSLGFSPVLGVDIPLQLSQGIIPTTHRTSFGGLCMENYILRCLIISRWRQGRIDL
jgi:hypothetical protein